MTLGLLKTQMRHKHMEKIKMEQLNKFEKARIITARALELSMGAKSSIEHEAKNMSDYKKIAEQELDKELLDLEIYKSQ